ncbi:hypothetical protein H6G33_09525 [Calothrix sp. FACHB-1219]|uniref:hypothetical protein n=1 Tax=unclassified Calothrix TaxID=2619626 RepID=UPI001688E78E|nr:MULTISPECIES: hypothetical protein [unclassified Calothrix]MBD2201586.1 hypothetical protein [Calothrix sp. FACHB-168]MBD2217272.1 hypothetical protein [Calothrix sp. FACHB-1219]
MSVKLFKPMYTNVKDGRMHSGRNWYQNIADCLIEASHYCDEFRKYRGILLECHLIETELFTDEEKTWE